MIALAGMIPTWLIDNYYYTPSTRHIYVPISDIVSRICEKGILQGLERLACKWIYIYDLILT